jgi:hypothetical protein
MGDRRLVPSTTASVTIISAPVTPATPISITPAPVSAAAPLAAPTPITAAGFFRSPALQHGLAAQAHLAALVHVGDHHHDLVADAYLVLNGGDTVIGKL